MRVGNSRPSYDAHFVVLLPTPRNNAKKGVSRDSYKVFNPWDGRVTQVSRTNLLSDSLSFGRFTLVTDVYTLDPVRSK
jgi:hypothetical protein